MIYWIFNIKTNGVNHLYLISKKVIGYFDEISGNKCLMLVSTNGSKEKNFREWGTCGMKSEI